METNNLSFEDGFQKVTINGDSERVIRWNPSDVGFIDRFITLQSWVEEDFKERVMGTGITKETGLDEYKQGTIFALGEELNKALDACFMAPVSEAAFQGTNPLSPIANGKLLFMNFLGALFPIIEKSVKDFDSARGKYTGAAKRNRRNQSRLGSSPLAEIGEVDDAGGDAT